MKSAVVQKQKREFAAPAKDTLSAENPVCPALLPFDGVKGIAVNAPVLRKQTSFPAVGSKNLHIYLTAFGIRLRYPTAKKSFQILFGSTQTSCRTEGKITTIREFICR